jgi:DNA-directed RNA polymerase specialized sigma24 family protein
MTQQTMIQRPAAPQYATSYSLPASEDLDLTKVEMSALVRWCSDESRSFYRHETHDPRYAYELFRRALVDRDEQAWAFLYQHYFPLAEHWVRRTGAFALSGESSEYFVSAAFTRFWRAIPAERFRSFPNLASLLNYLRRCANCVVIDAVRAHNWNDMLPEESVNWNNQAFAEADEEATERVHRVEFWNYISELLSNEAERVIVHSSFILGMKPGDIFAARSDLFAGVDEVYAMKRNILNRLRRNHELRAMYE